LRWPTNARGEAASIFRGAGLAAFRGLTGFIYGRNEMTLRQFLQDNFGWDIYDWDDEEIRF
jgi:hypothetical protein